MSLPPAQQIRERLRSWNHQRKSRRTLRRIIQWMASQSDFEGPVIYDIGARAGISPPYDRLAGMPLFRTVGFEADKEEAEKLKASKAFDFVCPTALGARDEKRILHIAKDPGSSSLFPPDGVEIARHTTWKLYETVRTVEVTVEPLDKAVGKHQLPLPDYAKIDCEGAEGEIMDGATQTFSHLCGLTFEARFRELYRGGATLSGLVDRMFRSGFVCLRLDPIGYFSGTLMMFDVVMMRHPEAIRDRRQFILALAFCLLQENWLYARRTVELRAKDFDCQGLCQEWGL